MKRALVLAAGYGTRLYPFTNTIPKALTPVWGVPLLERSIEKLEEWGVEEIAVNSHYLPEMVAEFVKSRRGSARLSLSYEPEILGTGGALVPLRRFFGSEPFFIVNADVLFSISKEALLRSFEEGGNFAAAMLVGSKGPRTVEADRRLRITEFASPEPGAKGTFTFAGVQVVSEEIFRWLPKWKKCFSIIEAYRSAMAEGRFVTGTVEAGQYWADCGRPGDWRKVHGETKALAFAKKRGGEYYVAARDRVAENETGFFCVAEGADVPPSVVGKDSIVLAGASLNEGAKVARSIIAGGEVGGKVSEADIVAVESIPELASLAGKFGAVEPLGARGSDRSFWRLYRGKARAIATSYSEKRPENSRYAGHAVLLKELGLPVPEILHSDEAKKILVMEDFGDLSLQKIVSKKPYEALERYTPVVKAVAKWHREVGKAVLEKGVELEPEFDNKLYRWEHGLFEKWLLDARYGIEKFPEGVRGELEGVAEKLGNVPEKVVLHRDLQSSNVLVKGRKFCFIDFQGMRFGPAVYDVASLLYDPYVSIAPVDRRELAALYFRETGRKGSWESELRLGAVQRLVQALGAYGRLSTQAGKAEFAKYIPIALETLHDLCILEKLEALHELCEELSRRERLRG